MNLHKTLAAISGMTMLAHHRTGPEILFARAFGASAYTDAFNIAFRIPNLLRRLFAEGAFSQAFVPILAEYKNRARPQRPSSWSTMWPRLMWVMLITCVAGIVATPSWSISSPPACNTTRTPSTPRC
jgi:putative peptidoglycan lipid II flippase